MSTKFQNQVCLITGAASGIGRATAIKMASLGARLALSDINLSGVEETKSLCRSSSLHCADTLDVSDSAAVKAYFSHVVARLERLDFVFNCAGVNPTAFPLTETTDAYWNTLVDTNLKGTYLVSRAAIPWLLEKSASASAAVVAEQSQKQNSTDYSAGNDDGEQAQGEAAAIASPGPAIVNVSSTMGIQAAPEYAIYCATKFGIVGFTKALALELGPKGIRVNAVAPGYIDTPTNAGVVAGPEAVRKQVEKVALGRMGTGEDVADVVAFLFSDESRYMTGSVVEITGGRT